jgi:epoxide hydrolase-like predicted phosphatase
MSRDFDALIVDFGGVLTTPLQDAMVVFAEELGLELQHIVRASLGVYTGAQDDLVVGFETGRISDDEFARAFAARLSEISGKTVDPDRLVERIFAGLRIEEDMMSAVERARSHGFKTGLLSNSWGMGLYPRERIDALFDAVVISGEVGMRKPDEEIFHLAVDKLDVPPERAVFVDDHPGHLKAALALGMTTVLHKAPAESIRQLEQLLGVDLGPA